MPWITKGGRHVYIGQRRRKDTLPKFKLPRNDFIQRIEEQKLRDRRITDFALKEVLNWTPVISELHTAYLLADIVFDNFDLISQTYNAYQDQGLAGIANTLGTDIAETTLSNIQTEIAWHCISKIVPPTIQESSKKLLSDVFDKVSSAEVDFAKSFLLNEGITSSQNKRQADFGPNSINYTTKQPRIPRDIRYV
jgi:hypothetical protein